jgi:O-antigen ligase
LFESGYSFGHYIAVAGALILLMPMRKFWKSILIVIVVFAGYSTLTRNTYLEIGFALAAALIFSRNRTSSSAGYILMGINALAGYAVMKLAPLISNLFGQLDIFDIYTHTSRVTEWDGIMQNWLSSDVFTALFGTGLTQGFGFNYVDNMYLAVGAQFGILGLIVFGLLFLAMTHYVFKQAAMRKTPLPTAIAAFWTTFPIVSFFNISLPPYIFVFIILIIGNKESGRGRRTVTNFMSGKMKTVTSVLSAVVIIISVILAELLTEILR